MFSGPVKSKMQKYDSPIKGVSKNETKTCHRSACSIKRHKLAGKKKVSEAKRKAEEGEIDSEYIDDSHMDLEPRNANIMTPSYQLKNAFSLNFLLYDHVYLSLRITFTLISKLRSVLNKTSNSCFKTSFSLANQKL